MRWADLNEADRTILIRDRKYLQEKLRNNQTIPLLGESFSIIKSQEPADDRILPYHGRASKGVF